MQLVFILWLDSKGLLKQWIEYTLADKEFDGISVLDKVKAKDFIMLAFLWTSTNEGEVFWASIHDEWAKIVKEVGK